MAAVEMNQEMFEQALAQDKPVLVDFWAPWCTYCRRISGAYDQIAQRYADRLIVGKVNIDDEELLAQQEQIEVIPTLVLYQKGRVVGSIVAPESRAMIEAFIDETLGTSAQTSSARVYDVVTIGGGPGGYTAALYAARSGLSTVVLEKLSAGGQMALTHQIDNYPGFEEGVEGFALAEKMRRQAERFGAQTEIAQVLSVDLHADPKVIETSAGTYYGRTVIAATGAAPKELGIAGERELTGHGIHYCAACDGMFYKGKTVVVVGGGNSAAADAAILSRLAARVILVHRRDTLRATKVYHEPLMNAANVEIRWNSEVTELIHGERVTGVRLRNVHTGEQTELACDGVFISVGRKPETKLFTGQLALDERGYVIAGESTQTNLPGVYAVGDVRTKLLRQVATAAADGAVAAYQAEEYLAPQKTR